MRFFIVIIVVVLFVVMGCEKSGPSVFDQAVIEQTPPVEQSLSWSTVTTIGNHSYLPINKYGTPYDYRVEILQVLGEFEKQHLEFQVTSWSVDKQQAAHGVSSYIYGLWIDHKPRN